MGGGGDSNTPPPSKLRLIIRLKNSIYACLYESSTAENKKSEPFICVNKQYKIREFILHDIAGQIRLRFHYVIKEPCFEHYI